MVNLLMHRHSAQRFEVKETDCHHHMMRQVDTGCQGEQRTNWQRVPAATVEQVRDECVEVIHD